MLLLGFVCRALVCGGGVAVGVGDVMSHGRSRGTVLGIPVVHDSGLCARVAATGGKQGDEITSTGARQGCHEL